LTTVMSIVLLFSFHERNPLLLGGGDTVIRVVGFILAIAPSVSAFSLDRLRQRSRHPSRSQSDGNQKMPIWPVRLLTWQLIVIYGISFQASICVLMDVGTFSIAMIASYAGLLIDDDFSAISARLRFGNLIGPPPSRVASS